MPIDQAAYDALVAKRQQGRAGSGADLFAAFNAAGNTVANIPQMPTPPPAVPPQPQGFQYNVPPMQQPQYPYRPLRGGGGPHVAPLDLSGALKAAESVRGGAGDHGIPEGSALTPLKHAIVASASSGDAYDRMLMKTVADARAEAISAVGRKAHPYAFVPVNDYKRGHMHIINANGHDIVLDMHNPQDQREYERIVSHTGMAGHELQNWANQSSKGLYQFLDPNQQEVKTDAGQQYGYGSWHPQQSPSMLPPAPGPVAPPRQWTDATPQKQQLNQLLGR